MTFLRYLAIQLLSYGIDMGTFLFILRIDLVGSVMANLIAKFVAGFFAYFIHRHFTFRVTAIGVATKIQGIRYFILLLLNIPVSSAIFSLLLIWLSQMVVAKFTADIFCVGVTYLLSKHFIFTDYSKKARSQGLGL
jgi:putative flippase GtrA